MVGVSIRTVQNGSHRLWYGLYVTPILLHSFDPLRMVDSLSLYVRCRCIVTSARANGERD